MSTVRQCELPASALLHRYRTEGAYVDCFVAHIDRDVSLETFVEAFYTTALFKLERLILRWCVARPSSDAQARQLAQGGTDSFAAWRVEARSDDQLLVGDFSGRTKSWFMVIAHSPSDTSTPSGTRLCFGSAVVPISYSPNGESELGALFRALLGFHRLYSRLLIGAARSQIRRSLRG